MPWPLEARLRRLAGAVHRSRALGPAGRVLRLAQMGLARHRVLFQASALAYDTVLALVPLLALVVALLKGLGAHELLVNGVVRPWIDRVFVAGSAQQITLHDAAMEALTLVEEANYAGLGVIGFLSTLYVIWVLLSTVEDTFNEIFAAPKRRAPIRKASDYLAIVFAVPLMSSGAAAMLVGAFAGEGTPMFDGLLHVASIVLAAFGLAFLYAAMPNIRIGARAALLGGFVGAVSMYAVFALLVYAQLGVARYNALYAGVAAIPLFLVFVFGSWVAVLLGAEVAAAIRKAPAYDWYVGGGTGSFARRRYLAVRLMTEIASRQRAGAPLPTLDELIGISRAPAPLVRRVLSELIERTLLVRSADAPQRYVPIRDFATLTVEDILEALARVPGEPPPPLDTETDRAVADAVDASFRSTARVPLYQLAASVEEREARGARSP